MSRPIARAVAGLLTGVLALAAAGCGGDDGHDERARPAVAQIVEAVAALELELDGPQEYFEINADAQLVNLFVATDDSTTVTPYLYLDGELQPPAPTRPVAEGATFTADQIDLDPERVLDQVADELPDSELTTFVVVVGPTDALRYEVLARSPRGGTLAVEVTGEGAIVGVESL